MKMCRAVMLVAIIGLIAIAVVSLINSGTDKPKESESRSLNTPSHGVGVLFGSPEYQVKGESVDGGFLDKKGVGEPVAPLPEEHREGATLNAPSDGRTSEE
ncbi:hypothetical protein WH06_22540 [Aeromonas salmonicida subsp. salmonicida]|jgi:hypothetical protein|uniref:Uncharacterized protein n=3 Tax=Aeromonas salmonicida subsp. salmonicida TaxID=29491 RepID=B2REF3_AERSS|nr:hypothetical protein [Aeromonas salmonicida]ABO92629.1 hypothetical protein ASA_P5G163 [Aeromonas salmonicida subsp. salmonicida A449]ASD49359.1 hypothetical protein [Aeromonas salmonicida subsp. salmonicida]EHI50179.1 hypothetical protein IYQ_23045 [Aeromonas salmonicida subsp. salmonicida 01-B526]EKP0241530.1 hypothetical protein [Aeromonas salmonicida]EKP0245631.1 hypothetical protein [Aeromonas salmonicida]